MIQNSNYHEKSKVAKGKQNLILLGAYINKLRQRIYTTFFDLLFPSNLTIVLRNA